MRNSYKNCVQSCGYSVYSWGQTVGALFTYCVQRLAAWMVAHTSPKLYAVLSLTYAPLNPLSFAGTNRGVHPLIPNIHTPNNSGYVGYLDINIRKTVEGGKRRSGNE